MPAHPASLVELSRLSADSLAGLKSPRGGLDEADGDSVASASTFASFTTARGWPRVAPAAPAAPAPPPGASYADVLLRRAEEAARARMVAAAAAAAAAEQQEAARSKVLRLQVSGSPPARTARAAAPLLARWLTGIGVSTYRSDRLPPPPARASCTAACSSLRRRRAAAQAGGGGCGWPEPDSTASMRRRSESRVKSCACEEDGGGDTGVSRYMCPTTTRKPCHWVAALCVRVYVCVRFLSRGEPSLLNVRLSVFMCPASSFLVTPARRRRSAKPPAAHAAQWHWPSGQWCSDQCHARARASQTRAGAASLGRVDLEQVRCHRASGLEVSNGQRPGEYRP